MSRRFLYLTPRFAPSATVGALRAVKFCRHLPAQGWQPVVLCDFDPARGFDASLSDLVPREVSVTADWRATTSAALAAASSRPWPAVAADGRSALRRRAARVVRSVAPWLIDVPRSLLREARLPLSVSELGSISYAVSSAVRLAERERCEAIVASGPPWEALLVGALVARRLWLPLILDLRDPWSLCLLERQSRSWLEQQRAELLERWCFAQAEVVLLNTQRSLDDYRKRYGETLGCRFELLRNHAEVHVAEARATDGPFRMVMPGRMRDRSMSSGLLDALRSLRAEGYTAEKLQFEVAAPLTQRATDALAATGASDMVVQRPWMPFADAISWMASADLLVVVTPEGDQRIPAKLYECLMQPSPVLVCGSTPELRELTAGMEQVLHCARSDGSAIASAIRAAIASRDLRVERSARALSSDVAASRLADLLDEVVTTAGVAERPRSE